VDALPLFERLGVALAIGLLIGLERGWHERERSEGERVAGLRTFGLSGLLGGVWALLAREGGDTVLGLGFAAFAAVLILAHSQMIRDRRYTDYGITTVVAGLLTFGLGALAVSGFISLAAAAAVVATLLLGLKPVLHEWVRKLTETELLATLKLLLISVVILPVLPNQGFGPWGALNPYAIWWLVVLITGISFVGYFAVKIMGPHRGVPVTGLFGGLASSTATALSFSRLGRNQPNLHRLLAAGVTIASVTMFPRILLEVGVVNPDLLPKVILPMAAMSLFGFGAAVLLWRSAPHAANTGEMELNNPFELWPALQFGALLAAIMLLAEAAQVWYGDAGIYLLAGISGITDVDAITLSLGRMARGDLSQDVAAGAITLAAIVNTAVKAGLVAVVGGRGMALPVGIIFALTLGVGGLTLFI
jgi:uncharacterized membrane protein (DUF4010 family)